MRYAAYTAVWFYLAAVCSGEAHAQQLVAPALLEGQSTRPSYPAAQEQAARARVTLQLLIDARGEVTNTTPVDVEIEPEGVASDPFVASARECAERLKFSPARRDGQPVSANIRFAFFIAPEPAPAPAEPTAAGNATPGSMSSASTSHTETVGDATKPVGTAGHAAKPTETFGDAGMPTSAPPASAGAPRPSEGSAAQPQSSPADAGMPTSAPPASAGAPQPSDGSAAQPPSSTTDASSLAARDAPKRGGYRALAHVHAGTRPPRASAASDLDIEIGALRDVPRRQAQDYLTLSPGAVLLNHAGIGHASSIFLRGFDAGEGQDLELLVDGVPINEPSNAHGHGYADTQFVIPELVERVHVQQGPFDPQQGDFAVAGSARYTLGVRERGLRAQLGYGRFNEQRALLLWAPTGADVGTFAALDLRRGDGFGPNRAHDSASAMGRYAGGDSALRYSLLLASHALDFSSAGVVRQDAVQSSALPCAKDQDSQFFCVADPNQGGAASRHLLSGKLKWRKPWRSFDLRAYGMLRQLRIRENFTGALYHPSGDGQDERYQTGSFGLHAGYTLTPKLWGRRQRLELGLDARHDRGETSMWRLRRDAGIPYESVFDRELSLTHLSGYLRGELSPTDWLSLLGGARLDVFAFHTLDLAGPHSDPVGPRLPAARDAWGSVGSPRGSVVVHAAQGFDWTLSAGLGARSSDAQALSEGEAAPFARVLALETGPSVSLPLARAGKLEARVFGFATRVENDLVFDAERGRNVPVGPSNRHGAALSARARFARQHDTLMSLTWTEAYQSERGQGLTDTGTRLPFVPRWVARVDHASRFTLEVAGERILLRAAAGLSYIGPTPLPLAELSQPRLQLDLALRARVGLWELGISIQNLLDARNRAAQLYYPSYFGEPGGLASMRAARHFAAAPPRLWLLTLTAYLDDDALIRGGTS